MTSPARSLDYRRNKKPPAKRGALSLSKLKYSIEQRP